MDGDSKSEMKGFWIAIYVLGMAVLFAGCGGSSANPSSEDGSDGSAGTEDSDPNGGKSMEAGGLRLTVLEGSAAFPDAKLGLVSPPAGADLAAGTNRFEFNATGFQLGMQTPDQTSRGLANDAKGQYAAVVLNSGPFIPMYSAAMDQTLDDGHYVMLVFPSRSYHQSMKRAKGHILRQFNVGQPENYKELDTKAPHVFYHWPTGTLRGGGETTKVLLDFYLVNCELSPDGYKVKATINGHAFTLTRWEAYRIEGLPMGENTIRLELVDETGKPVESPYNPVERTFTLEAGA